MSTNNKIVEILRQKVGEFALTLLDLNDRGVNTMCTPQECIEQLADNMSNETDTNYKVEKKDNEYTTTDYKTYIKFIMNTQKYAGDIEFYLLNVLLCNNGFPCYFDIRVKNKNGDRTQPYGKDTFIYKMHMVLGDLNGEPMERPNHFNVLIPTNLNISKQYKLDAYSNDFKLLKISPDGDCFYTAVAVWCEIYGIKEDHLNYLTYNIPSEISEDMMAYHNKVSSTLSDQTKKNLPFTLDLGNIGNIGNMSIKIAKKLKENMNRLDLIFNDPKNIQDSEDYKAYIESGVSKNNGTHCNKYKGNTSVGLSTPKFVQL